MEDLILYLNKNNKPEIDISNLKSVYTEIFPEVYFQEVEKPAFFCLGAANRKDKLDRGILYSKQSNTFILISGTIFIPEEWKREKKSDFENYNAFVTHIYDEYGIEAFKNINGWFNVVTIQENTLRIELFNSKLGLDTLYYYLSNNEIIISNRLKIFSAIKSDLTLNQGVVLQQSLYNYPFSNQSILQQVELFPSASLAIIENGKIESHKYWSIQDDMTAHPLGFSDSVELLDESLDNVVKRYLQQPGRKSLSLTGGWDGRLLLAYALKYVSPDELLLYSFGAENSPDIIIPKRISDKLGYRYFSIPLNAEYMENEFFSRASATVINSDSGRSFKRAHYLYAMDILSRKSDVVLTGVGGSNLLKSSAYAPCNVFNKYVLELIHSTDFDSTVKSHYDYIQKQFGEHIVMPSLKDFRDSFESKETLNLFKIESKSERFTNYLISNIERKYFGAEIKSYRHLVSNFAPFFDAEFLHALMKTMFFGGYPAKNSKEAVFLNSRLYARLITRNNKDLAKQATDRGFSMYEVNNPLLLGNLVYKYWKHRREIKRNPFSHYNTDGALHVFLQNSNLNIHGLAALEKVNKEFVSNYISIEWFKKSLQP